MYWFTLYADVLFVIAFTCDTFTADKFLATDTSSPPSYFLPTLSTIYHRYKPLMDDLF